MTSVVNVIFFFSLTSSSGSYETTAISSLISSVRDNSLCLCFVYILQTIVFFVFYLIKIRNDLFVLDWNHENQNDQNKNQWNQQQQKKWMKKSYISIEHLKSKYLLKRKSLTVSTAVSMIRFSQSFVPPNPTRLATYRAIEILWCTRWPSTSKTGIWPIGIAIACQKSSKIKSKIIQKWDQNQFIIRFKRNAFIRIRCEKNK